MSLSLRSVLWPTDFSPLSLVAADAAQELADRFHAALHVVAVAPPLVPDSTVALETGGDLLVSTTDVRGRAQAELQRLVESYCRADGGIVTATLIGTPWFEICQYVERNGIDLVVIATHGRSGLRHVLLGSVAERVVRHATCPVLVVRSFPLAALD